MMGFFLLSPSNQVIIGSDITPVIFVDGISKVFNRAGGPGYAALSSLIPGLGVILWQITA
jgi:hypothetical protein